jgi:DNA repair exonuclease SbcCD ATPase subunit
VVLVEAESTAINLAAEEFRENSHSCCSDLFLPLLFLSSSLPAHSCRTEPKQQTNTPLNTRLMDHATVDDISARWKVRYQVSLLAREHSTVASNAPDIRSSFLKCRADLLRSNKKLGSAPTMEDELKDTIEELIETRKENQDLRVKLSETLTELDQLKEERKTDQDTVAQLRAELDAIKQTLKEKQEKEDEEKRQKEEAAKKASAPSKSPGHVTPSRSRTSTTGATTPGRRTDSPRRPQFR